jgi:hypothetical protein
MSQEENRIPYEEAKVLADELLEKLKPFSHKIMIVGSIRN